MKNLLPPLCLRSFSTHNTTRDMWSVLDWIQILIWQQKRKDILFLFGRVEGIDNLKGILLQNNFQTWRIFMFEKTWLDFHFFPITKVTRNLAVHFSVPLNFYDSIIGEASLFLQKWLIHLKCNLDLTHAHFATHALGTGPYCRSWRKELPLQF